MAGIVDEWQALGDEWKARAEQAERERDEWQALADEYRAAAEKCYEAWQR